MAAGALGGCNVGGEAGVDEASGCRFDECGARVVVAAYDALGQPGGADDDGGALVTLSTATATEVDDGGGGVAARKRSSAADRGAPASRSPTASRRWSDGRVVYVDGWNGRSTMGEVKRAPDAPDATVTLAASVVVRLRECVAGESRVLDAGGAVECVPCASGTFRLTAPTGGRGRARRATTPTRGGGACAAARARRSLCAAATGARPARRSCARAARGCRPPRRRGGNDTAAQCDRQHGRADARPAPRPRRRMTSSGAARRATATRARTASPRPRPRRSRCCSPRARSRATARRSARS